MVIIIYFWITIIVAHSLMNVGTVILFVKIHSIMIGDHFNKGLRYLIPIRLRAYNILTPSISSGVRGHFFNFPGKISSSNDDFNLCAFLWNCSENIYIFQQWLQFVYLSHELGHGRIMVSIWAIFVWCKFLLGNRKGIFVSPSSLMDYWKYITSIYHGYHG